jgi:hypothetical protein
MFRAPQCSTLQVGSRESSAHSPSQSKTTIVAPIQSPELLW